jgi:hypothetical protein
MGFRPPPSAGGGSAAFRTDSVGNLGAAHTSTLGTETWLTTTGTLNANHVETIAGRAAGKFVVLRLQQDATGGRTLQISDGTTPTSVTINSAANAVTDILIICKDATDFDVVVLGASGAEPTLSVTGATGNLGTTQTVDFQSVAREKWLAGTLNGNLAVTVSNPVAGSRLRVLAVQDGTGGRTLTIAGQAVTIPTTATTGVAMVLAVWLDATTFRVESSGVYTESDPNAVLKSLGTTKGDTAVWTASGTPRGKRSARTARSSSPTRRRRTAASGGSRPSPSRSARRARRRSPPGRCATASRSPPSSSRSPPRSAPRRPGRA